MEARVRCGDCGGGGGGGGNNDDGPKLCAAREHRGERERIHVLSA
jgi:hypothetical protein